MVIVEINKEISTIELLLTFKNIFKYKNESLFHVFTRSSNNSNFLQSKVKTAKQNVIELRYRVFKIYKKNTYIWSSNFI